METSHLQQITAAKTAVDSLLALADNSCKKGALRDDSHAIADEASLIIKELEEKAFSRNSDLTPEDIADAANIVQDVIKKLEARLDAAVRDNQAPGILNRLGLGSHKSIFQDAREGLKSAWLCLGVEPLSSQRSGMLPTSSSGSRTAALQDSSDAAPGAARVYHRGRHLQRGAHGDEQQRPSPPSKTTQLVQSKLAAQQQQRMAQQQLGQDAQPQPQRASQQLLSSQLLPQKPSQQLQQQGSQQLQQQPSQQQPPPASQQQQQHPQLPQFQPEQQQQQQQLSHAAPALPKLPDIKLPLGSVLHALSLVPAGRKDDNNQAVLWLGLHRKVEFQPTWTADKTEYSISDKNHVITCITYDPTTGNVWTGHANGAVMLHSSGKWGVAGLGHPPGHPCPIRSMAVDQRHHCWTGDDSGWIRVVASDPHTKGLVLSYQDKPSVAGGWGVGASGAAPVHAMLSYRAMVVTSGGKWAHNLTLWNAQNHEMVDVHNCESFGAALSFAVVPWDDEEDSAAAAAAAAATSSKAAAAAVEEPDSRQGSSSSDSGIGGCGWRLLSGHEKGQVLLWHMRGFPKPPGVHRVLQQLAVIGEQQPKSAIRGMAVFPGCTMLVLAHESGNLTALPLPTATNGAAPTAARLQQQQQVTAARQGSADVSGALPSLSLTAPLPSVGGVSSRLHQWTPRGAVIRAHKGGIVAVTSWDELLVTASHRNVTPWTAERLRLEAQGDGLFLTRRSKQAAKLSGSSSADNSGLGTATSDAVSGAQAAAAAAAPQAASRQKLKQHQQQQQHVPEYPPVQHSVRVPLQSQPQQQQQLQQQQQQQHAQQQLPVKGRTHVPSSDAGWLACDRPQMLPPLPEASSLEQSSLQVPVRLQQQQQQQKLSSQQQQQQLQQPQLLRSQVTVLHHVAPPRQQQASIKLQHVINNSELVFKEVIGSGAEGKVYHGTWVNVDIAAKEYLVPDDLDSAGHHSEAAVQRAMDALLKEVSLLTSLSHPNLVRFCGVCLDPPLLVMEYYRHGSVFNLLDRARRKLAKSRNPDAPAGTDTKVVTSLTWDRRLGMLHDVAAGMMFLHTRKYVHGDLRSPNLFVGTDGQVKIGDFGFVKQLASGSDSMQVRRVTHPRWVAPELMTKNRLSTASDVYSFGIVMHEMLTWRVPFHELSKEQVSAHVIAGGRPSMPSSEDMPPGPCSASGMAAYVRLMEQCWHEDPSQRPAFHHIAERLKAMIRWRMIIRAYRTRSSAWLRLRRKAAEHATPAGSHAGSNGSAPAAAAVGSQYSSSSSAGSRGDPQSRLQAAAAAASTRSYPVVGFGVADVAAAARRLSPGFPEEATALYPEPDYSLAHEYSTVLQGPPSSSWAADEPPPSSAFPYSGGNSRSYQQSSSTREFPSSGYTAAEQYESSMYASGTLTGGASVLMRDLGSLRSVDTVATPIPSNSRFQSRRIYSGISSYAASSVVGASPSVASGVTGDAGDVISGDATGVTSDTVGMLQGLDPGWLAPVAGSSQGTTAGMPAPEAGASPGKTSSGVINAEIDVVEQAAKELEAWYLSEQSRRQQYAAAGDAAAAAAPAAVEEDVEKEEQLAVSSEVMQHVIKMRDLTLKDVLSETADGKVHVGTWCGIDITAKQYYSAEDIRSRGVESAMYSNYAQLVRAQKSLLEHVAALASLSHPNLVRICGVCLDPPLVVTEYHRHNVFGILQQARRQWRGEDDAARSEASSSRASSIRRRYVEWLTWQRRLEMLSDVAAGMMCLHRWGFVRGDLRSKCLFVTADGQVKVGGDLAYCRQLAGDEHSITLEAVPRDPRWVAPEMMRFKRLSRAADVYSFGIIMYEMLTWREPFQNLGKRDIINSVIRRGRPEVPPTLELPPGTAPATAGSGLASYLQLMGSCWDNDPDRRPMFDQIASCLLEIRQHDSGAAGAAAAAAAVAAGISANRDPTVGDLGAGSSRAAAAAAPNADSDAAAADKAACSSKHAGEGSSEGLSMQAGTLPMESSPFADSTYLELPPLQLEADISAPGTPHASSGASGEPKPLLQGLDTVDHQGTEMLAGLEQRSVAEQQQTQLQQHEQLAGDAAAAAGWAPAVTAATAAAAAAISRQQQQQQQRLDLEQSSVFPAAANAPAKDAAPAAAAPPGAAAGPPCLSAIEASTAAHLPAASSATGIVAAQVSGAAPAAFTAATAAAAAGSTLHDVGLLPEHKVTLCPAASSPRAMQPVCSIARSPDSASAAAAAATASTVIEAETIATSSAGALPVVPLVADQAGKDNGDAGGLSGEGPAMPAAAAAAAAAGGMAQAATAAAAAAGGTAGVASSSSTPADAAAAAGLPQVATAAAAAAAGSIADVASSSATPVDAAAAAATAATEATAAQSASSLAPSDTLQVPPPVTVTSAAVQQHILQLEQLRPLLGSQLLRLVLLHTLYIAANTASTVQLYLEPVQRQHQHQQQQQFDSLGRQQEMVALQLQLLNRHLLQFQQQEALGWPELLPLLLSVWQLHSRLSSWQQTADELLMQQATLDQQAAQSSSGSSSSGSIIAVVVPALVVWCLCRFLLPAFVARVATTAAAGALMWIQLSSWANSGSSSSSSGSAAEATIRQRNAGVPTAAAAASNLPCKFRLQPISSSVNGSTGSTHAAPRQQAGMAVQLADLASLTLNFTVYRSMPELPASVKFAVQPNSASSTVGHTSWAIQMDAVTPAAAAAAAAPAATGAATGSTPSASKQLMLLHTLPEHRYTAFWRRAKNDTAPAPAAAAVAAAAATGDDTSLSYDQGEQEDSGRTADNTAGDTAHNAAGSTVGGAAPGTVGGTVGGTFSGTLETGAVQLVSPAHHPILSTGVISMALPTAAFLQAVSALTKLQYTPQQQQQQQSPSSTCSLFAPVHWVCLNPPLLLEALPPGATLAEWLLYQQQQQVGQLRRLYCHSSSSSSGRWQPPFAGELLLQVLQWLVEIAAALVELHKHDTVHGGVQAGAVHLVGGGSSSSKGWQHQQQQQVQLQAYLSLAAPWQHAVTNGRVVDPAFAPPELNNKGENPSGKPAVDVYGFGMLMWQVATGWVPQQQQQQQGSGFGPTWQQGSRVHNSVALETELYEELHWCAEMMSIYGTTFPGVIGSEPPAYPRTAAGPAAAAGSAASSSGSSSSTLYRNAALFAADADAACRHGSLPAAADAWLPSGYRQLMMACCRSEPASRVTMQVVYERVAALLAANSLRPWYPDI